MRESPTLSVQNNWQSTWTFISYKMWLQKPLPLKEWFWSAQQLVTAHLTLVSRRPSRAVKGLESLEKNMNMLNKSDFYAWGICIPWSSGPAALDPFSLGFWTPALLVPRSKQPNSNCIACENSSQEFKHHQIWSDFSRLSTVPNHSHCKLVLTFSPSSQLQEGESTGVHFEPPDTAWVLHLANSSLPRAKLHKALAFNPLFPFLSSLKNNWCVGRKVI